MDLRELRYISALAKHGSVTRAAEELGITQPTLSRFLLAAEERYGVRLFERIGKRLVITPSGREFVRRSQEILRLGQQLEDRMADLASRDGGHISLAITPSRAKHVLPNILPDFHAKYPDHEIEIHEGSVLEVTRMLEEGLVNLGLFNIRGGGYPNLVLEEVCTEEILLCVGRDSPYPAMAQWRKGFHYPWIDLSRLGGEIFLASHGSFIIGPVNKELLEYYDISPYIITTADLDLNISLAANGFGVCFCTEINADFCYIKKPPAFLSIGPEPVRVTFVAAYHKDSYLSEAARELIRITKRVFSKGE